MKAQITVPVALVLSLVLLGLMKVRKRETEKQESQHKLQNIKLRVTNEFLDEYLIDVAEKNNQLERLKLDIKTTEEEVTKLIANEERMKEDLVLCQETEKSDSDELIVMETDFNNLKAEGEKEETLWEKKITGLKEQLVERSVICNFLKKGKSNARNICGDKEPEEEVKEETLEEKQAKEENPAEVGPQEEIPQNVVEKQERVNKEEAKKSKKEEKAEAPEEEHPEVEVKGKEEKAGVPKMEQSIKKKETLR